MNIVRNVRYRLAFCYVFQSLLSLYTYINHPRTLATATRVTSILTLKNLNDM
jgi:hypothetical protein